MKGIRRWLPVLGLTTALSGCGGSDGVPYPSDQALLERFTAQRSAFQQLVEDPEDPELMASLGITRTRALPGSGRELLVWYHDLPGPGGCAKGFAYLGEAPRAPVGAIEDRWEACPPEEAELYRRIEGNWYIFLRASN